MLNVRNKSYRDTPKNFTQLGMVRVRQLKLDIIRGSSKDGTPAFELPSDATTPQFTATEYASLCSLDGLSG